MWLQIHGRDTHACTFDVILVDSGGTPSIAKSFMFDYFPSLSVLSRFFENPFKENKY